MACLYLVSCNPNEPAHCIIETGTLNTFSTQLIDLWDNYQLINPGYAPLIRLYNGDPTNSPFFSSNGGTDALLYGCYHVVYTGHAPCSEWQAETTASPATLHYTQCNGMATSVNLPDNTIRTVCVLNGTTPYFTPSAGNTVNDESVACSIPCDCATATQFPGITDIPPRTSIPLGITNTIVGRQYPPTYTVYDGTTTESVPCDICNNALWLVDCITGDIIEVFNSTYGLTGDPIADQNWAILINTMGSGGVISINNNPYIPSSSYQVSFANDYFYIPQTTPSFLAYDIQGWNSTVLPVAGYFTQCSNAGTNNYYRLVDCSGNYTYDLLDNSNVVAGSLASYVGKIVKLILPTSLTGLPDPVLTCVQVTTLSSCNSCTTHDLVVVTSNFISCDQCVKCYTATRCDNPNISVHIQTQSLFFTSTVGSCTDLCKDCQTTAYISLPEGADPSCWIVTNKCANVDLPTYNIDLFNSPTYELTCSPDPCGACNSTCYRVVSCDGTFQITLMNPTLVGASIVILDTPVQINVSTGDPLTQYFSGCAIITELDTCNPIGNTFPVTPSEITYVLDSGDQPVLCSCDPPPPPTFKITRCDDFGIFFIVSTDLSSTIGNVISGVNIINCSPTVGLCSSIKPEQCWLVSISSILSTLEMTYTSVYPNCECCYKPCN